MAEADKGFRGTKQEQKRFYEVEKHRVMAQEDLDDRIPDLNAKDELFRNWLDESTWPYRALVTDPRIWTMIVDKTSRLIAGKPRGELLPREGGDVLKARIQNELLDFQWDEVARIGDPMVARWALMDMNARKYGAAFGIMTWHWQKDKSGQVVFDGPTFRVIPNRDALPNPSYSTIKNWFQYRDYLTLEELENVNNTASGPPIYRNLKLLREAIDDEEKDNAGSGGDLRSSVYQSRNKEITGVEDYLGRDVTRKVVEVITEMGPDRWITFAPNHGVILRDIPNPYDHGQIPVVLLKYYVIDDDIYGLSEIEPVEKLQKATNALICQYLDTVNTDLYPPLKIRSTGVRMNTIDFGPNKRWIMNDPLTDVVKMETSTSSTSRFTQTYSFLIAAMMNASGASSLGVSNVGGMQQRKTAEEVKNLMGSQNARDNFNQIFLAEALKKQMMLWHMMNKQFIFSDPKKKYLPLRVSGTKALKFFQEQGMDMIRPTQEEALLASLNPNAVEEMGSGPAYPVEIEGETKPKFDLDVTGRGGTLYIVPEDMTGNYDYKADIVSMSLPDNYAERMALQDAIGKIVENYQALMTEGYKPKLKELLVRYLETTQYFRDADQYFEAIEGGEYGNTGLEQTATPIPGGGGESGAGRVAPGVNPPKGMARGTQAVPGKLPQSFMGQPQGMQR